MFGTMLAVFEFVLLSMIAPKWRLRLLGSKAGCNALHVSVLVLNMWIHRATNTVTTLAQNESVALMVPMTVPQ
jgi:hypothetical protein